jgi:hypothetical protein
MSIGEAQAGGAERGAYTVSTLPHCRITQTDNGEFGHTLADLHFAVHMESVHADQTTAVNLLKHPNTLALF